MEAKYTLLATLALLLQILLFVKVQAQPRIFDITRYSAKVNSQDDISQALLSAWTEACAATSPSKVVIPKGTFYLNQAKLEGPCKGSTIEIEVQGTLIAPSDSSQLKVSEAEWFTVNYVDQLTISGGGTFDGQGEASWKSNDCGNNVKCKKLPNNLSFNYLTNSMIRDITTLNTKSFHVNVYGCKDLTFLNFKAIAPGDSPNTDGIHIGRSSGINILSSTFGTGDDCISIGDGSKQITIDKVTCGPGHGISIGSLGKFDNEEDVIGIFVRNCTLINTANGARVKTWPDSKPGLASDIHFEDIIMNDVANPIVVDQEYCPWNQCSTKNPSRVKLSKMGFKNIRGTSTTQVVVKIVCSKNLPCENVEIGDIDLTYNGNQAGPAITSCANVNPRFMGKQNPAVCA